MSKWYKNEKNTKRLRYIRLLFSSLFYMRCDNRRNKSDGIAPFTRSPFVHYIER